MESDRRSAVSGPLDEKILFAPEDPSAQSERTVEIMPARRSEVSGTPVRRSLPQRGRRTVGAWCFFDHFGPVDSSAEQRFDVGPHPHVGLQTVTWLLAGEIVHHDSLGTEQRIRPGQLNLMSAGEGVAHSEEEERTYRGQVHGAQLWVAQPESTRHGPAAFEHHSDLPVFEFGSGSATVLVGELDHQIAPARHDSELLGVDLDLVRGTVTLPLDASFEHALVVLDGAVLIEGVRADPGNLCYLGTRRDELTLSVQEPTRALLIGGPPFEEELFMWWNFVARSREEITEAYWDWQNERNRFGSVHSSLARIPANPPAWLTKSEKPERSV
jgi:redox-sensitive bicupin YhaK (pirin superfamily)